ncbi:MAG: lysozyme inhibitor LprI family protein [Pseudomonadota bacterium]
MIALIASLGLLSSLAVQNVEQEIDPADRAIVGACVAAARARAEDASACVGRVASPCMERPGGDTTVGMVTCAGREHAIWDERLNAAYRALRQALDHEYAQNRREALLIAQRAWIRYRDAECSQQALQFEGGTLASVISTSCYLEMTAERALELEAQLEDADL